MADFTSEFWNVYIALLTLLGIVGCGVLLWSQSRARIDTSTDAEGKPQTTGHSWDEVNNTMPRWWMWLFYITVVFALFYLALYPGLGAFAGKLGWHSASAYQSELKKAEADYGPLFARFQQQDIQVVARDPQAQAIGERLFLTYCAQCHGSDARGSKGFPNLTDSDWLYGGTPEAIKTTILGGRNGQMPAMEQALGSARDVENVAHYVVSLSSDAAVDPIKKVLGKDKFGACMACHGADGSGNQAVGAPRLNDRIWLYGGSVETIMETIRKGRSNTMPPFKDFLGDAKVHVLAAYVWHLSHDTATTAQK